MRKRRRVRLGENVSRPERTLHEGARPRLELGGRRHQRPKTGCTTLCGATWRDPCAN
jgi:hypothetical protein